MTTLEVKLELPEGLAKEAQDAGLLSPQAIEQLLKDAVRRRANEEDARDAAAKRLGDAMAKLAALDLPPMTQEEIQAEIDAVRRERRERLGADRR